MPAPCDLNRINLVGSDKLQDIYFSFFAHVCLKIFVVTKIYEVKPFAATNESNKMFQVLFALTYWSMQKVGDVRDEVNCLFSHHHYLSNLKLLKLRVSANR